MVLVLLGISIAVGIAMTSFLVMNPLYGMPRLQPYTDFETAFLHVFRFVHTPMGFNGLPSGIFRDAAYGAVQVFVLLMIPTAAWWIVSDGLRFVHTRIRRA